MMNHSSGSPASFSRETVLSKALCAGGESVKQKPLLCLLLSPSLCRAGFGDSSPSLAVLGGMQRRLFVSVLGLSVKGETFSFPPNLRGLGHEGAVWSEGCHRERPRGTASSEADISFPFSLRGIFQGQCWGVWTEFLLMKAMFSSGAMEVRAELALKDCIDLTDGDPERLTQKNAGW